MNQRTLLRRRLVSNLETLLQQRLCPLPTCLGVVVNRAQRVTSRHGISNFLVQHKSHSRIDRVFLPLATPAQNDARRSRSLTLDRGHISARRADYVERVLRLRQTLWII